MNAKGSRPVDDGETMFNVNNNPTETEMQDFIDNLDECEAECLYTLAQDGSMAEGLSDEEDAAWDMFHAAGIIDDHGVATEAAAALLDLMERQ